jgi:hypothetical protein
MLSLNAAISAADCKPAGDESRVNRIRRHDEWHIMVFIDSDSVSLFPLFRSSSLSLRAHPRADRVP